jgi:hypothetical protein
VGFGSGERDRVGMLLSLPDAALERRAKFLARFEIAAPDLARQGIPARLARAEIRVRW